MNALSPSQIVVEVARLKGGYSLAAFYRHKLELDLQPTGARQRPQLYPADTANRILTHLGISAGPIATVEPGRSVAENEARPQPNKAKAARRDTRAALVTLPKLRRERAAAKRKVTR